MDSDKAAVLAHRLNNMPPLLSLVDESRNKRFDPVVRVLEAQSDYLIELKQIVIEVFNEVQTHNHPHEHPQPLDLFRPIGS